MRENEFEKQVREIMDQLGFEPSEAVWAGVDKEINTEKKRRVPLVWLFFVSGLLLAGGAYYFITNKNISGTVAKIQKLERDSKKQTEQPAVQSAEPQKNNNEKNEGTTETGNKQQHFAVTSSMIKKHVDQTAGLRSGKKQIHAIKKIKTNEIDESGQDAAAAGTDDIVIKNYSNKDAKTETEKDNKKIFDSTAGKMVSAETKNKSKKDSVTNSTTAKKKEQKPRSSPWKIGYTVSAGVSNLNQNLFNSVKTLSPVSYSAAAPTPTGNSGNINYSSSQISPGFSFEAGAFVNRNLSTRFSFSAGISYHYYSTTIRTGIKINTTLVTTNSINQVIVADNYFENARNHTFTNQYHLIEIPLSVNYQVNKSKRKPFIWELGLTPGYIVSSNALYYDPNTNVYFSNYLQPNKMQLNGVTALMFGFPLHKSEIQIGPQVQYGFTSFVNTNDGNPGHLFYAGLKISFIPGKK